jgi:hypothetical protein
VPFTASFDPFAVCLGTHGDSRLSSCPPRGTAMRIC